MLVAGGISIQTIVGRCSNEDGTGGILFHCAFPRLVFKDGLFSPPVCHWGGVARLECSKKGLSFLDAAVLGKLQNVSHVDLSNNSDLQALPAAVGTLSKLTLLDISGTLLSACLCKLVTSPLGNSSNIFLKNPKKKSGISDCFIEKS